MINGSQFIIYFCNLNAQNYHNENYCTTPVSSNPL